jgi:hypothetical protein
MLAIIQEFVENSINEDSDRNEYWTKYSKSQFKIIINQKRIAT